MRIVAFAAALLAAAPVSAQSVGLIVANEDYANLRDVSRGDRIANAEDSLRDAGMQVVTRRDANLRDLEFALVEFGQMAGQSETLLVALSGRFLKSATETYYLPTDAEAGPLATLASKALPLSTVLAWLAAKPGEAVLALATDEADATYGAFLSDGIGQIDVPQGVTILIGDPVSVERFLESTLAQPGRPFVGRARQAGLQVLGYASNANVFLDAPAPRPAADTDRRTDISDWRAASAANTAAAYEAYIAAHPTGEFVLMAENRLRTLTDTPEARAERAEQALDLSRDARREIQRDLTLLGYNTRGIDGIFGRGTRAAIANWQKDQGFAATGFIQRDEIARLDGQAERKAAELEAEAEKRRQEQLAADLAFWDSTGAVGDEAGLRAYLGRYPDGEYSDIARERLTALEEDKREQANEFDRRLWDYATNLDTIEGYEEYLARSDRGAFTAEAEARILELEEEERTSGDTEAAMREEQAMNLTPRTRQLVESRLKALGMEPGDVDGVFDEKTRRAIRRYQATRNTPETGYLSESLVVQLLADSVRQILR